MNKNRLKNIEEKDNQIKNMSEIYKEGIIALFEEIQEGQNELKKLIQERSVSAEGDNPVSIISSTSEADNSKHFEQKLNTLLNYLSESETNIVHGLNSIIRKIDKIPNHTEILEELEVNRNTQQFIQDGITRIEQDKEPKKVTYSFDIRHSKLFLFVGTLLSIVIICIVISSHFVSQNSKLKDNDLKYRYIKALHLNNNDNSELILDLENTFRYPKSKKEIDDIKKYVSDFEKKK